MAVDAIVSFAVERLGDLLIQEAKFLYGVSGQVQNIQTELRRMRCLLKDAVLKASGGDETVSNWVAEIRDLAYDAEDVIETYALEVASRRRKAGIINVLKRYACILNEGIALHKIGSEIEAFTAKISNLTRSLQTYGIKDLKDGSSSSGHQRPPSYSHVIEPYFVGRDESIEELVKHLVDTEKNYRIVSICGMGGLGKTTLAKKIYHHGEVKRQFDYLAWSCISQQCNPRDVWEGILIKLNEPRDEIKKLRDEEIAEKLYQVQQEKRCLVILDDIWSTQDWDNLKAAFPYDGTSSKILVTTRNQEIAFHADSTGFHYEPRYLDEEESWELLRKIAIPQENGVDIRMKELGKKMLKHCGGLPLAIIVLGGILATKHSSEWHKVLETIKSCLKRGNGHGKEQLGVSGVLTLSYDDLPTELKPCFLYLSHFPEDYEIYVDKLIQLWVAEGIVSSKQHNNEEGEETMEDMAERYLNELVKRCMVLVGERDASLRIRTCRMHDLMRDLCLSKAEEENFLRTVDCRNGDENIDSFPSSSSGKIRKLAIYMHQSGSESLLKTIKNPHLRSLLCFPELQDNKCSLEMPIFNNLKLLRVLDVGFENRSRHRNPRRLKLSTDIGKLIHLRYLSLKYTCVSELPSSLGDLRCLQTLNLLLLSDTVHVPNVLWKLEGLRHLYLPQSCDNKTKLQLGNLRNLLTLMNFSGIFCDVRDLVNMTNLRVLYISDLYLIRDFGETFESLGMTLQHLRRLNIFFQQVKIDVGPFVSGCINLYEFTITGAIEKLPDSHQLPANIIDLFLYFTQLEEDPMTILEKLLNLRTLTLDWKAFVGKQMVCCGEGFPQLHSLILGSMDNLEEWRVDEGALANLCHLEIKDCWELKRLPDGLRFVKTLKELEIKVMPKEFREKLVEGGEDFYKVQHVASIIFKDPWFE